MTAGRLSIFLGKGGVGRTTLASAYAVDRAAAGERVLLAAVSSAGDPFSRIQHEAAGVDTGGRLDLLRIDTRALVDDLVRKMTRVGAVADLILKHPSYDSLVSIVPGIHQLALFHLLAQKREGHDGSPAYDRIVLDAPATGHGLNFLEAPEKASRILAGALKERALALDAMLKDPAVTDIIIVTIPEEMPVRETIELAARLRKESFPLDNVVVNNWLPSVFAEEASQDILTRLTQDADARGRFERSISSRSSVDVEAWLRALNHVASRRRENVEHLAELESLDVKLAVVPLIPESARRLPKVAEAMKELRTEVTA